MHQQIFKNMLSELKEYVPLSAYPATYLEYFIAEE